MTFYSSITANKIKTGLLFAFFPIAIALITGWISHLINPGQATGMTLMAIVFAITYGLISYYGGPRITLSMNGAKPLSADQYPHVYNLVQNLSITAGLPHPPALYYLEDASINAFATGRNPQTSAIALTRGALEKLDNSELEGVLAHELSHIKNYDVLIMLAVIILINVLQLMAEFLFRSAAWSRRDSERQGGSLILIGLVVYVVGGLIGFLVQQSISRRREFIADANAALLTRYPTGLANALRKIATNHPAEKIAGKRNFASLYIANPLKPGWFSRLFSSHPPLEDRIAALENFGEI